jgi:hypothetical protein
MPRTCTVCQHEDVGEIDAALVRGVSPYELESRYIALSHDAIQRHKDNGHIASSLLKAQAVREIANADKVQAELEGALSRVNKLFDACDEWLTDPDDPTRYDVGSRAHEVRVIYQDGGKSKKASLQELLERVEGEGRVITMVETKHADPRDLLLKTAGRLQAQLELIAKLLGELDDRPQINLHISPEWLELRALIVKTLTPHPEALGDLTRALESAENQVEEQWQR